MPSPIAHSGMGYVIYKLYANKAQQKSASIILKTVLIGLSVVLSLFPDLDVILGVIYGNIDNFHNGISHSLIVGLMVAVGIACLAWVVLRWGFIFWFVFALLSYELHVVMDFFTVGRGVMLFWPFSSERFFPPFMLFYGMRRSEGLVSFHHIITLLTETLFVIFLLLVLKLLNQKPLIEVTMYKQFFSEWVQKLSFR